MPNAVLHLQLSPVSHPTFQEGTSYDESNNSFFLKNSTKTYVRKTNFQQLLLSTHRLYEFKIHKQEVSSCVHPQLTDLKLQIRNLQYTFPTQCETTFFLKSRNVFCEMRART